MEGNYKCGFDVIVAAELDTDFGQVFTFLVPLELCKLPYKVNSLYISGSLLCVAVPSNHYNPCVHLPGIFSFLLCGVLPALEVQPRTMLIPRRGEGTQESSNQALFACIEVGERDEMRQGSEH